MDGKPFYKSKTFWFNLLALIVAIANAFGYAEFKPDPHVADLAMGMIAVMNLVLRFMTKEPVYVLPRREEEGEG